MNEIETVKLNDEEQLLFGAVCWDLDKLEKKDHAAQVDVLEKMGQLAELLLARQAISTVRLDYFTKPQMNIGGSGKSRKQVIEKNGTSGREILRHHDFMKYLRYFINGPDLPKETIRGFCKISEDDVGTSGVVLNQIRSYVRKEVRDKSLSVSHAAEEFFKLAHEINRPEWAESVRAASKEVRT
jgi:hypothetical protein